MRPSSASLRANRGFTLVESLLVLALLVLAGVVLLPSAAALFRAGRSENPEEKVALILQQARREAVLSGRELVMQFDPRTQRFTWDGFAGAGLGPEAARLEVGFLRPGGTSAVLIGGQIVETSLVPTLRFFPDGTCEPVRVQLRQAGGSAHIMAIDPWTCAPGLETKS